MGANRHCKPEGGADECRAAKSKIHVPCLLDKVLASKLNGELSQHGLKPGGTRAGHGPERGQIATLGLAKDRSVGRKGWTW